MIATARAVLGGALGRNRGRLALSVVAIALGVALGLRGRAGQRLGRRGVQRRHEDARRARPTSRCAGRAAASTKRVFARLARDPDIAVASPVVEVDARLAGRDDALRIYGVDAFRAAAVTPALRRQRRRPARPAASGQRVRHARRRRHGWRCRPATRCACKPACAPLPLDGRRLRAGRTRRALRGDGHRRGAGRVRARRHRCRASICACGPGAAVDAVARPHRARAARGRDGGGAARTTRRRRMRMSRAYRVNLNVLALVALFTGGLLVFSTQALSVVRRRPQFALLRTLGVTRGAARGAAGRGRRADRRRRSARGSRRRLCARLRGAARGRRRSRRRLLSRRRAAARARSRAQRSRSALIGVAVAALGSYVPAREAARARPAAALKAGDEQQAFARLRSPVPGSRASSRRRRAGLAAAGGGPAARSATPRSRCC